MIPSAPTLIASDVDGTLITDDDRVTPRTRDAISRATEAGATFIIATGRPPRWIPQITDQLDVAPLCVCANGSAIYDSATDTVLWESQLDPGTLRKLAALVEEVLPGAGYAVERFESHADSLTPSFAATHNYRHAWLQPDAIVQQASEIVARPAMKMLVREQQCTSAEIADRLAPHLGGCAELTYSTDDGLIELQMPGLSKASGIQRAATEFLGIDPSNCVAFGDMPNDLEMLRWARIGIAMGNAGPLVRSVADEVTATNADDGLAQVLERWF